MASSLSTPGEIKKGEAKFVDRKLEKPMTADEFSSACKDLDDKSFTTNYPRVEQRFSDPIIELQRIGLVSFVPAKGATPNKDGLYGFAKLRGNYANEREASDRAEKLIRDVDSYHKIYHCYVGRPFPLTINDNFSKNVDEIDIEQEITEGMKDDLKKKKREEKKIKKEIDERAKNLKKDMEAELEDPEEVYTMLRVKKAQLQWAYLEHERKMKEIKDLVIETRAKIEKFDKSHPELRDSYYSKYMDARKAAGLKVGEKDLQDSFLKYIVEDANLGF